jgi:hypothetical protein
LRRQGLISNEEVLALPPRIDGYAEQIHVVFQLGLQDKSYVRAKLKLHTLAKKMPAQEVVKESRHFKDNE